MRRALITGVLGQDGSYLAELLLEHGYEVHGLVRRSSSSNTERIDGFKHRINLHEGDLLDEGSLTRIVCEVQPDEVYNLAAQSHVQTSFTCPVYTAEASGVGSLKLLEAVRQSGCGARFYQASTSEMFGGMQRPPQHEATPFHPRSPYGCAKLYAHWATINAREAYGMFACSGILFNHESPRRGEAFVTRKITRAAARIKMGLQQEVTLGNLDAQRDWGHARDYVRAMWMMLHHREPDDFVIATGEMHTVREFAELAFGHLGLDYQEFVRIDPKFMRPAEVNVLCGNAEKAERLLGWRSETTLRQLVSEMVATDLEIAKREAKLAAA